MVLVRSLKLTEVFMCLPKVEFVSTVSEEAAGLNPSTALLVKRTWTGIDL